MIYFRHKLLLLRDQHSSETILLAPTHAAQNYLTSVLDTTTRHPTYLHSKIFNIQAHMHKMSFDNAKKGFF